MKKFLIGLGILMAIGAVGQLVTPAPPPKSAAELAADSVRLRERAEAREDRERVRRAEDLVTRRLKDPESAKFTEVTVERFSGGPVVCGYVNARNGFGGYTGPEPFMMGSGAVPVLTSDLGERGFNRDWNASCVKPSKR